MEEENIPQTQESNNEISLKFSLWFYIALALSIVVFVVVSAVLKEVCYWAAAVGFAVLFAQFLLLSVKSKSALFIAVTSISGAAFALMLTLWIMRLCGMG